MSTPVTPERFDAVLFDLDGVLTSTAKVHSACWKETFDDFLRKRAEETGEPFREFTLDDYHRYVDGKPRYDGVRSFLASRGIHLPDGDPTDPPGTGTVCAVGNRKDALVKQAIRSQGVEVYEGSIAWVRQLLSKDIKVAVVSSSKNCATVLDAAGITGLFQARVDGVVAAEQGLPGKPAPDIFLEAARRLGVEPARAVVVEDAISGVQAGRAGHFGLVIGVARTVPPDDLRAGGADVVVTDLGELLE